MAWTTPLTAASNAALTAAQWNASVRDNLLMTAPALATTAGSIFAATGTNSIAQRIPAAITQQAIETTTSTSYTPTLSGGAGTAGPTLTVTVGAKVLITFHSRQTTSVNDINVYTSVAIGAPTSRAASDSWCVSADAVNLDIIHGNAFIDPNLSAGSQDFTMQYRAGGATTATFSNRRLNILPF